MNNSDVCAHPADGHCCQLLVFTLISDKLDNIPKLECLRKEASQAKQYSSRTDLDVVLGKDWESPQSWGGERVADCSEAKSWESGPEGGTEAKSAIDAGDELGLS